MRVFVTGATGFVGAAVVSELMAAGHSVLGLTRSDEGAAQLEAAGARVHRGSLEDLGSLRDGAAKADGVIHTAFNHDFSIYKESCEAERGIVAALGEGLAGSDRPLVITSALGLLPPGQLATEQTPPNTSNPRFASEQAADRLAERGARVSVVRLPFSVHGLGEKAGFVPILIKLAREKGISGFIDGGRNRWPAVQRQDAARLYRLALEKKSEPGTRYHCVAEEGVPFREIATVIARRLALPVVDVPTEDAASHFGWFTHFASLDVPSSSEWTRAQLGWQPTGAGLIADIDQPGYFRA